MTDGQSINERENFLKRAEIYLIGDQIKEALSSSVHGAKAFNNRQAYSLEGLLTEPLGVSEAILGTGANDWDNWDQEKRNQYIASLPESKRNEIITAGFESRYLTSKSDAAITLAGKSDEVLKEGGKFAKGLEALALSKEVSERISHEHRPLVDAYRMILQADVLLEKVKAGQRLNKEEEKVIVPYLEHVQNDRMSKYVKSLRGSGKNYNEATISAVSKVASTMVRELSSKDYENALSAVKSHTNEVLKEQVGEDYLDKVREIVAGAVHEMADSGNSKLEETAIRLAYSALKQQ
ncbi:MAG: hypothetical protein AABX66_01010 [Nanoarchaeota archaeon]